MCRGGGSKELEWRELAPIGIPYTTAVWNFVYFMYKLLVDHCTCSCNCTMGVQTFWEMVDPSLEPEVPPEKLCILHLLGTSKFGKNRFDFPFNLSLKIY